MGGKGYPSMGKTFDQGKNDVAKLCRYFETNRQLFLAPGVKEAHIRQSLIDPFFMALGWDVHNQFKTAPQYREVIPEDSLDVEGHQKAPDYTFRVGSQAKFYAEAKKCGININADPGPAYQLRRYGWSAKVVLSLLTDFDELGVYDCTLRPRPSDKASHARVQYFRSEEYPDRWRELWDYFSREAVWSGTFDQYAASKRKRGTSEVDAEFLKEIEGWRDELARNVALRNPDISLDDLNAAILLTIDRIVFLRMAEDRGIEPYEQLLKLCERPDIYSRFMRDSCRKADEKYNSGLFHFQKEAGIPDVPDRITPNLAVDDKVVKPILQSLYFEFGSPYHFGVMPVEILGTVYERFLGKVIRLTEGHQAKIEEKPEVRKAGGVYYTPSYIVDYIVKNTVGKQIISKSPAQLAGAKSAPPFRVLDMACGSGSFLLGAYQNLLDHCLSWYLDNKPEIHKKAVYKDSRSGQWRLTIEEKKRILITHIFGVDIDLQAVEVSKLSLLLKVLEGETDQSFGRQMQLYQDRALPNLSDNLKCGNSLIGSDYFAGRLDIDPEELKRVNPLDWNQAFPEAMKAGGFDSVVGNPPYLYSAAHEDPDYFTTHYRLGQYQTDYYVYFMEKALRLCRKGGLNSFIVSDAWLNSQYFSKLRNYVLTNHRLAGLAVFSYPVFKEATLENSIYLLEKAASPSPFPVVLFASPRSFSHINTLSPIDCVKRNLVDPRQSQTAARILEKVEHTSIALGTLVRINRGIHAYRTDGYGKSKFGRGPQTDRDKAERSYHATRPLNKTYLPELRGKQVYRFFHSKPDEYLSYGDWLAEPRTPEFFNRPKIAVRKVLGKKLSGTYLHTSFAIDQSLYIMISEKDDIGLLKTILGILLSTVGAWYIRTKHAIYDTLYPWYTKDQLSVFPLPPSFSTKQDRMVSLVDSMLSLSTQLTTVKSAAQKDAIQRQIDATDAEIDRLVYELYSLTDDEIKLVEEGTK
jgi:TaqI-like C-terminal specificity domain/Eco57I restriction-modification methylase/N-6 DNA Methylase